MYKQKPEQDMKMGSKSITKVNRTSIRSYTDIFYKEVMRVIDRFILLVCL